MPKIETPRNFADTIWAAIDENWGDAEACYKAMTALIAARDTAIRAESAALLKMCGDKIEQALQEVKAIETYDAACTLTEALDALRETGVI